MVWTRLITVRQISAHVNFQTPSWNGAIVYMWRINREQGHQARPDAAGQRLGKKI